MENRISLWKCINIKFNFDEKQNYYLKSDSWGYYSIWLLLEFSLWLPTSTLTIINLIYFSIAWRFSSFFSGGKTTNLGNGRKLNECSSLLSFPLRIVNKGFGYGQWMAPFSPFANRSLVQMPASFAETTFLVSFSAHHSKSINKFYRFVFIVFVFEFRQQKE